MQCGFENDAAYFEIIAQQQLDSAVRKELLEVAAAYHRLASTKGGSLVGTREERWRKRAEECRTLAEQFQNEKCRAHLLRLATSYDLLAGDVQVDSIIASQA
jgi:hypothetical protein